MHQEEPGNDNFFASALDMLTCGLGATALLFILFSVVHVEPEKSAAVEPFINVIFEVSGEKVPIQLRPVLKTPGGAMIQLPPDCFDDETGRLNRSDSARQRYPSDFAALDAAAPAGDYELMGFALNRDRAPRVSGKRVFRMHIRNPAPGSWEIGARFFAFADTIGSRRDVVQVQTTVKTRDGRYLGGSYMGYGGFSARVAVPITP